MAFVEVYRLFRRCDMKFPGHSPPVPSPRWLIEWKWTTGPKTNASRGPSMEDYSGIELAPVKSVTIKVDERRIKLKIHSLLRRFT